MKTCKDCIHFDVCEIADMLCDGILTFSNPKNIKMCKLFTDKDLYIKLPCKIGDEEVKAELKRRNEQ